jgi:hypothetical protein
MTKAANLANLASNTNFGILNIYRGGTGVGQFDNPGVLYYDGTATSLIVGITPVSAGGTGMTTFPANSAIYANGVNSLTAGVLPTQGGGTGLATFNTAGALYALDANTITTGTLPTISGGTGNSGLANNSLLVGHGLDPIQTIAPGAANNVLLSDGTRWYAANAVSRGIGIIPKPSAANNILIDTGIDWVSVSSKGLLVNPGASSNLMVSDGSSWTSVASKGILGAVGTAGNILTSDGSSWGSQINPAFGISQSWSNKTSSRALGSAYTNNTSRPMMISISAVSTNPTIQANTVTLSIDGVVVAQATAATTTNIQGIVPSNKTYIVTVNGTVSLINWAEFA